jgi:hypothetical protein
LRARKEEGSRSFLQKSTKKLLLFCGIACCGYLFVRGMAAAETLPSYVVVIPSLHKRLAGNPHYNYADLYGLVASFRPDFVGVEIRQEDLGRSDSYLHHNYPEEMVALARAYKGRVFGFDWLGEELKGRQIPDDWWTKQSRIKQLERACNSAPPPTSPRLAQLGAQLDALYRQQDEIVGTATAASLADGRYDKVTASYYQIGAELTRGTPCEAVSTWFTARDHEISANIVKDVLDHPGRRIAIVTGVDHHGPVISALSSEVRSVVIVPVK